MNENRYIVVTAPTVEPVTLAEAREHCRIDNDDENRALIRMIQTAREQVENDTSRSLITQTLRLYMDAFPAGDYIALSRPPLATVTSVQYVDTAGATQTFSSGDYIVDVAREPGRVVLAYGESWPTARAQVNAVQVNYTAGWTTTTIPAAAKHLVLLWVAHFYENREPVNIGNIVNAIPMAIESLTYRLRWGNYE